MWLKWWEAAVLSLAVPAELGAATTYELYLFNPIIFLDLAGETETPALADHLSIQQWLY